MKINELTNLFVGRNETEDISVLIVALDANEASDIARQYCFDTNSRGVFEIKKFDDIDTRFDCDYVLTAE